ncbi:MAG: Holliday junction branch migration protein RuvA [Lentisphaerae bacterium]|nr:Holliday junction branch migration protein RuvA [Lentisphaerota bacterium]
MISYLEGIVAEKQPTRVVMDVGGVGYEVFIPLCTYDRLPAVGERCKLLTHDHVREDTRQLFGFTSEDERSTFTMLLGISGVGPKLALSALSGLSARELKAAVVEGDVKRLSSISGIGKRTAERIVLELRGRIKPGEALEAVAGGDPQSSDNIRLRDTVLALIALGYQQEPARKMAMQALKGGEELGVEDLIKRSLGGGRA